MLTRTMMVLAWSECAFLIVGDLIMVIGCGGCWCCVIVIGKVGSVIVIATTRSCFLVYLVRPGYGKCRHPVRRGSAMVSSRLVEIGGVG